VKELRRVQADKGIGDGDGDGDGGGGEGDSMGWWLCEGRGGDGCSGLALSSPCVR
jgi:hypothetical protein